MTKLSHKKLLVQVKDQLAAQLFAAIILLETQQEVSLFFKNLLSRTELQMLSKRLAIVRMLSEGYRYSEIRKSLNVSDVTIAKINDLYESFGHGYQLVLQRLERAIHKRDKSRIVRGQIRNTQDLWLAAGKEVVKQYKKYKKRRSVSY